MGRSTALAWPSMGCGAKLLSQVNVALFVVQTNFSVGAIVASIGMPSLNPLMFALIREAAAGTLLSLCAWSRGAPRSVPRREDWGRFIVIGCCVAGTQLFAIVGLTLSSQAVDFALWQPTQPIFVAAASIMVGWEVPHLKRLVGIACAMAGCVVSATADAHAGASRKTVDIAAHGLFAASCACGATYQLLAKGVLEKYPALSVAAWCYDIAALVVAVASLATSHVDQRFLCPACRSGFWKVPRSALPALMWWIVMSTVLNYALQVWAIKHSSPTLVTASSALQPVLTAAMTITLLSLRPRLNCHREASSTCLSAPGYPDAVACVLIFIGLALVLHTESADLPALRQRGSPSTPPDILVDTSVSPSAKLLQVPPTDTHEVLWRPPQADSRMRNVVSSRTFFW